MNDSPSTAAERGRVRLLFLDGIRGFAALYVVFFHLQQHIDANFRGPMLSAGWQLVKNLLDFGHLTVVVFIVLSGFCLMLPVARTTGLTIQGGLKSYLMRRARRILPAYYAALAASLALIASVPILQNPGVDRWASALPAFDNGTILSHVFLVHAFVSNWSGRIDPPMWSVAVEWWIYFLFPSILLPLWRRFGMLPTLVFSAVVGLSPHWLFQARFDYICPWFLTLFATGAAAAYITFSPAAEWERKLPWGLIAILTAALAIGPLIVDKGFFLTRTYLSDSIVGLAVAAFLVWCSQCALQPKSRHWWLVLLESRVAIFLGTISYSLYLVHYPIIPLFSIPLHATGWSGDTRLAILLFGATPVILIASYIFHLLFERPFMIGHPKTSMKAAVSAAIEPAP